ncbi:hypothetical protein CF326_g6539 [Tilletia indica]|nr:hypothetical protein CF326_g6539 [Tilletia indica]
MYVSFFPTEEIFSEDDEDVTSAPSIPDWPQPIDASTVQERLQEFRQQTTLVIGPTCAVCSRRSFNKPLLYTDLGEPFQQVSANDLSEGLPLLEITDEHILARNDNHLSFEHPLLAGLALDKNGVHYRDGSPHLDICQDCHSSLTSSPPKLPALSLANSNIRGWLPPDLQDCTWLEERLCAKYLASAYIIRLYDVTSPGAPETRPRVMKGHACAFPLNTVSTAVKLPWTFSDAGPLLSCLVIGPRPPRQQDLQKVFTVRRQKVLDLLKFLRANFLDYPQFPIDDDALNQLPENDVPELLMRFVVHQQQGDVPSLFEEETSGLESHPGLSANDDLEAAEGRTFLEHHGLVDLNGVSVPGHARMVTGLASAAGFGNPDLLIKHGIDFIRDYDNPSMFPGMFPTLFPWGTGGFEQKREVPLAFKRQATHLLDIADPSFRRHWSYVFVVANIRHRRLIHLGSRLACKARDFEEVARELESLDVQTIRNVASHLGDGGCMRTLSAQEANVQRLLKKCELISVRVPGSKAAMNLARAEIRSYIGEHGIFQLFLTLNPNPLHSPVFQVFFGDTGVNLNLRVPMDLSAHERSLRVADDPIAASDYFHFHVSAVFRYLFGWDFKQKQSTPQGGLLGHLAAFYMVKEHTMRGQRHCHCLLWLEGGLNPSVLRAKMRSDEDFQQRYFAFFDDLLRHGYPDGDTGAQEQPETTSRAPRQERPPSPADPTYRDDFHCDHHLLAHEVQLHRCTFTCFKGGRKSCRFLFPHEVTATSTFDNETSSVHLRVQHPLINWHNPSLLVATRHNHDLKVVQSGKSGSAAATYITTYTTKSDETPANQISMINTVYERMASLGSNTSDPRAVLTRCVMQFGRERQVHAQQAATYVRDLGDTEQSHKTVAMLSGALTARVLRLFGPVRNLNSLPTDVEENASFESMPIPVPNDASADNSFPPGPDTGRGSHNMFSVTTVEQDANDVADTSNTVPHTAADEDEDDGFAEEGLMPLNNKGYAHQVDDYLNRGDTLTALSFYNFVQYVVLDKAPKERNNTHHDLAATHPNAETHIHRYTPDKAQGIPRCLVSRFPRSNGTILHGDDYCASMMAHFIPFTTSSPLKDKDCTWEQAFARASFPPSALRIMENWSALNECEDARDADQLQRRRREANQSSSIDKQVADLSTHGIDDSLADVNLEALLHGRPTTSAESLKYAATLDSAGWFHVDSPGGGPVPSQLPPTPAVSWQTKRTWKKEQDILEAKAKADLVIPTASHGILAEQLTFDSPNVQPNTTLDTAILPNLPPPATTLLAWKDRPPHELLNALVKERNLTPSQALAFNIAGRRFFETLHGLPTEPLRLLMHGEAGTGKTVVVRLLRELMDRYGRGNEIKFMAPTGKAASAIGGMTQHSAFGLEVHRRGLTTEERQDAQRDNQPKRMRFLQTSFGHIQWLFFDEVSMTSCEVFHEIDQALRIGTQRLDEPFGGINVLFAGDLCQLPPVGAAPLYTRTSRASLASSTRTKVELGRLSWLYIKDVVEFTEQMRMKDADMAAALSRLRVRACIDGDAALFNASALYRPSAAQQVSVKNRRDLIVLAATNQTVRTMNVRKATSQAATQSLSLVISHAIDDTNATLNADTREALLNYNGRGESRVGMGRLPLFAGMPVVYRGPNQSVALGITNGAFGKVIGWDILRDNTGLTVPKAAIVRFDENATWQLTGLEPGCLPIYPTSSTFSFSLPDTPDIVHRITRQQLPLQPGFAMTVHSAQGITSAGGVVVDLTRGGFPAYVAASRATRREDIFLMSEVSRRQLNTPGLPVSLQSELARLRALAETTKSVHDHNTWRLGPTNQQQEDLETRPSKRLRTS